MYQDGPRGYPSVSTIYFNPRHMLYEEPLYFDGLWELHGFWNEVEYLERLDGRGLKQ